MEVVETNVVARKKTVRPKITTQFKMRQIEVTRQEIDHAVRENSHSCMIVEAIKRTVPGVRNVSVDVQTIRFTDVKNNRRIACLTPPVCQLNLVRFDRGMPLKPFKFDLKSVQVSALRVVQAKRDEKGEVIRKPRTVKRRLADGSVKIVTDTQPVYETIQEPTGVRELSNKGKPNRDHIIGGNMPPQHVPSFQRKFGMKGFTWDDDEAERSTPSATTGMTDALRRPDD